METGQKESNMKKIFLSILILSVYFSSGCLGNRKSALERFKEKNPIDGMLFSEKSKSKAAKPTQGNSSNEKYTVNSIDLSGLKKIPDQPISRLIKVSGENVALRKGPGSEYGKLGTAKKDQTFSSSSNSKKIFTTTKRGISLRMKIKISSSYRAFHLPLIKVNP